jgi:hypothetical protein
MVTSTKVAPPNSLVLVSGLGGAEIPKTLNDGLIASTDSCVAVGCQSDADGETEFTLGATHEVDPGGQPAFQGSLATPGGKLVIQSVLGHKILEAPVKQQRTYIRIWVNDPIEPNKVIVGIDNNK